FKTHQHINQREPDSTLPGPPARADTCAHVNAHGEGKGREGERKGTEGIPIESAQAPSIGTGPLDLKRERFMRGVLFLKTYGLDDRHARNILGKWRRDHGDAAVINVLASAEANAVSEVIPYVEKSLRNGLHHGTGLNYHPGGAFAALA